MEAALAAAGTSQSQSRASGVSPMVTAGCQVYWPAPYEVCGRIRDKYNQTGGPSGFLLYPKTNELTNPGNTGKRTEFLGGNIYWSAATDAHPVAHDFLTEWGNNGYEAGYLKYPTTDEIVLANGRRQEYQGGGIFWSAASGAHTLHGTIRTKWEQKGGETGPLGYPITNEMAVPDWLHSYGDIAQFFQGGAIVWRASDNTATDGNWLDYVSPNGGFEVPGDPALTTKGPAGVPNTKPLLAAPAGTVSPMFRSDCPDEIGHYTGENAVYNCVTRFKDLAGNWNNLRVGAAGRFGQQHYKVDHHVEDHAVELLLQDTVPIHQTRRNQPSGTRFYYAKKFHIADNDLIGFMAVTDWGSSPYAPDNTQFGIVTSYCFDPKGETTIQYCPDILLPFNVKNGQ